MYVFMVCFFSIIIFCCCCCCCFCWTDVYDSVEYLSSLGKAQTANVKRDAAVGVAQANRDAGIRVTYHFLYHLSS